MATTATATPTQGGKPKWGGLVLAACLIVPLSIASYMGNKGGGGGNGSAESAATPAPDGAEVHAAPTPAEPPEATRFVNNVPVPVSIPASGRTRIFPIRRSDNTCPSEYPEEYGYRILCHVRGTPSSVLAPFNNEEGGAANCRNVDGLAFESTDGRPKEIELNFVRSTETCPVPD